MNKREGDRETERKRERESNKQTNSQINRATVDVHLAIKRPQHKGQTAHFIAKITKSC